MSVYYDKNRKNWVARVSNNGKRYYAGAFRTEAEAHQAERDKIGQLKKLENITLENYQMKYEKTPWFKTVWRKGKYGRK